MILFTGRRWFITVWNEEDVFSVEKIRSVLSAPFFHAYWSRIYEKSTLVFSTPTESIMPVSEDVRWDVLGATKSRGDFGAFGFGKVFSLQQCVVRRSTARFHWSVAWTAAVKTTLVYVRTIGQATSVNSRSLPKLRR